MKRNTPVAYAMLAAMLLPVRLPAHNTDRERLAAMQSLHAREVIYDSITTVDNIIRWGERILPTLGGEEQSAIRLQLRYQLIFAYILQGDGALAAYYIRQMMEHETAAHPALTSLYANLSVGHLYAYSYRRSQAIPYYRKAIGLASLHSPGGMRWSITHSLVTALLQTGQTDEARRLLQAEEEFLSRHPRHPLHFLFHINHAALSICTHDNGQASLHLAKADSVARLRHEPFETYVLNYMRATLCRARGQGAEALDMFDHTLRTSPNYPNFMEYRFHSTERIFLNKQMHRYAEAAAVYKELYASMDSIARQSHDRQVGTLRTSLLTEEQELANKTAAQRTTLRILLLCLALLALIAWAGIKLKRQQVKVRLSQQHLARERRRAENAIRTKSFFLSNMSHEIRTPLNALSGFSSLLTTDSLDNDTRAQCNEVIQQNSELLLKLINDVIDLSNMECNKMKFNLALTDVVPLCQAVVETVDKIKQTRAELRFECGKAPLYACTDSARLQQVLINLIVNATKFTPEGSITLSVEQTGGELLFSVTDTGCGIAPEQQSTIFRRFEKLDESAQGTGLGLSICRLIIEQMGGKIAVDPDYTGGARFYFTHPAAPGGSGPANPGKEDPS